FQSEWIHAAEVFQILRCDSGERRHGKEINLLKALSMVVKGKVRYAMVFTGDLSTHAETLHQSVAFERVGIEGLPELSFLRRKLANDLVDLRLAQSVRAGGCRRGTFGIR